MNLNELKYQKTILISFLIISLIVLVMSLGGFFSSSDAKEALKTNTEEEIKSDQPAKPALLRPSESPHNAGKGTNNFETDSDVPETYKKKKKPVEQEKKEPANNKPMSDEPTTKDDNQDTQNKESPQFPKEEGAVPSNPTNSEDQNILNSKANNVEEKKPGKAPDRQPEGKVYQAEPKVKSSPPMKENIHLKFVGGYLLTDSAFFVVYKYENGDEDSENVFIEVSNRPDAFMTVIDKKGKTHVIDSSHKANANMKDSKIDFITLPDDDSVSSCVEYSKNNFMRLSILGNPAKISIVGVESFNAGGFFQYKMDDLESEILQIFASDNGEEKIINDFKEFLLKGRIYHPIDLDAHNLNVKILISVKTPSTAKAVVEKPSILKKKEVTTANRSVKTKGESDDEAFYDANTGDLGIPELIIDDIDDYIPEIKRVVSDSVGAPTDPKAHIFNSDSNALIDVQPEVVVQETNGTIEEPIIDNVSIEEETEKSNTDDDSEIPVKNSDDSKFSNSGETAGTNAAEVIMNPKDHDINVLDKALKDETYNGNDADDPTNMGAVPEILTDVDKIAEIESPKFAPEVPDFVPIGACRYETDPEFKGTYKFKALHRFADMNQEAFIFSLGVHRLDEYSTFDKDDRAIFPPLENTNLSDELEIKPKKKEIEEITNVPLFKFERIIGDYIYTVYFGGEASTFWYSYDQIATKLIEIVESNDDMFEQFLAYTVSGMFYSPFDCRNPDSKIIVKRTSVTN